MWTLVYDCVCMFILNVFLMQESFTNNCTKYERVWFSYRVKFLMHVNYNDFYNNCHYLWVFVIIHAWSLLVEVFFKESASEVWIKPIHIYYPCWTIHFIGCVSVCFFYVRFSNLPRPPINPIPHKTTLILY
jgi:hypothetical protein